MAKHLEFTEQRTLATRAAQNTLALTWIWEEKSPAEWDADLAAFTAQRETAQDAEADMLGQRGNLDAALDDLHSLTRRGLSMARNRFRTDSAKRKVLRGLKTSSRSRPGRLQDALAWESAWEELDPAWSPLPGLTLAGFKTQRQAAQGLLETYTAGQANWSNEDQKLGSLADGLTDDCVAWYEAATTVFAAGTVEGDLIRSTVPTSYNPPNHAPTALEIATLVNKGVGVVAVLYVSGGGSAATSLRLLWQIVGQDGDFVHDTAVEPGGQWVTGLPTGASVNFKTRASNVAGSTESAVQSIVVT